MIDTRAVWHVAAVDAPVDATRFCSKRREDQRWQKWPNVERREETAGYNGGDIYGDMAGDGIVHVYVHVDGDRDSTVCAWADATSHFGRHA
jgi:hypothetical protein